VVNKQHTAKGCGTSTVTGAAFFDVDETLVNAKTMFDFLSFHLRAHGDDGGAYRRATEQLDRLAAAGVSREEINRHYYRFYTGCRWSELLTEGRRWAAEFLARPDALIPAAVAALQRHQEAGHLVVLVSGSFQPCLDPIATRLGADTVRCTQPVVAEDGRLTGDVVRPIIGCAKADAVQEIIEVQNLTPAACFGYADHASDLAMLRSVGQPSVIGTDPVLIQTARTLGWPMLSASNQRSS
jgi:HAD superfamily hydrolase (TIGR01490 family)